MPSFDEYLTKGLVTSSYLLVAPTSFLGMTEASTDEEAFDWLRNKPKALLASATICRMLDDIVSHEVLIQNKRNKLSMFFPSISRPLFESLTLVSYIYMAMAYKGIINYRDWFGQSDNVSL